MRDEKCREAIRRIVGDMIAKAIEHPDVSSFIRTKGGVESAAAIAGIGNLLLDAIDRQTQPLPRQDAS
jgi:hypothetical protein